MKKFDAFLYLSSVSAGVGMIAANLFSVYDVSDYQPAVLPVVVPMMSMVSAEHTSMPQPQAGCVDCLLPAPPALGGSVAKGLVSGKVLTNRDLAGAAVPVVPVAGAGVRK